MRKNILLLPISLLIACNAIHTEKEATSADGGNVLRDVRSLITNSSSEVSDVKLAFKDGQLTIDAIAKNDKARDLLQETLPLIDGVDSVKASISVNPAYVPTGRDQELQKNVDAKLAQIRPTLGDSIVSSRVIDGVTVVTGAIATDTLREPVLRAVASVSGVESIDDYLFVAPAKEDQRIGNEVMKEIMARADPKQAFAVDSKDGVVVLNVGKGMDDTRFEKMRAAASSVAGVKSVKRDEFRLE